MITNKFKLIGVGLFFLFNFSFASIPVLNYDLIKKGEFLNDNNILLVVGGISGDEPGGFLAASLLATEYTIKKGKVWIVPNINFPSIIKRHRGVYGDMNRKFSHINEDDPDYQAVIDMKALITDPKVALVVNLHDGSGFYREKYINEQYNPNRWGNSCIIDQTSIEGAKYGNLHEIATQIATHVNKHLIKEDHKYGVKNTRTREGDVEMLKSLTYFAVTQNKPSFGNEASKNLNANQRTYYHMLALEKYMDIMGIEYERKYDLTLRGINEVVNNKTKLGLFDKKVYFDLSSPRKLIRFVPMPNTNQVSYEASNPLLAVIKEGNGYKVHYGNRFLTKLVPQYFDFEEDTKKIQVKVDGVDKNIIFGDTLKVKKYFNIVPEENIRINVIGYSNKKSKNESGFDIYENQIVKSFSIDKKGKTFRVELYHTSKDTSKKDIFGGMFLVEFVKQEEKILTNSENSNELDFIRSLKEK